MNSDSPRNPTAKKCAVALSGGVDSAVAALLLKQAGYNVTGVFARNWPESRCCSSLQEADVDRVALALSIPLLKIDVMVDFVRQVVDPFCESYLEGKTPSPCTQCNRKVRFGVLWDRLLPHQFAFMASGHYARIEYEATDDTYILRRGLDASKDQSYMLYGLDQNQLRRTRTPLGKLTKEMVRKLAREANLPVAEKAESQDICFVQHSYADFVTQYTEKIPSQGEIVDETGNVLGVHEGIHLFTVGQRRGLNLSASHKQYVIDIDAKKHQVVVGPETSLYQQTLIAESVHWIVPHEPERLDHHRLQIEAQIRYNAGSAPCTIQRRGNHEVEVRFQSPQRAITPGQAIVFYQQDRVLGGGFIARAKDISN